jgi:hypothetical protein
VLTATNTARKRKNSNELNNIESEWSMPSQ